MSNQVLYGEADASSQNGEPVECYLIRDTSPDGYEFLLTSAPAPVVLERDGSGLFFSPSGIRRSSIRYTTKKGHGTLSLTLEGNESGQGLREFIIENDNRVELEIEVYRAHRQRERTAEQIEAENLVLDNISSVDIDGDTDVTSEDREFDVTDVLSTHPFTEQGQYRKVWTGFLAGFSFLGQELELKLSGLGDQSKRQVPSRKFGWACGHVWGNDLCSLDKEDYFSERRVGFFHDPGDGTFILGPRVSGTVTDTGSVNFLTKTAEFADYFSGGWVQIGDDSSSSRTIVAQGLTAQGYHFVRINGKLPVGFNPGTGSGSSTTEGYEIYQSSDGDTLRFYAGCDHAPTTCRSKFNNFPQFGGFPNVPDFNPFADRITTEQAFQRPKIAFR